MPLASVIPIKFTSLHGVRMMRYLNLVLATERPPCIAFKLKVTILLLKETRALKSAHVVAHSFLVLNRHSEWLTSTANKSIEVDNSFSLASSRLRQAEIEHFQDK